MANLSVSAPTHELSDKSTQTQSSCQLNLRTNIIQPGFQGPLSTPAIIAAEIRVHVGALKIQARAHMGPLYPWFVWPSATLRSSHEENISASMEAYSEFLDTAASFKNNTLFSKKNCWTIIHTTTKKSLRIRNRKY